MNNKELATNYILQMLYLDYLREHLIFNRFS